MKTSQASEQISRKPLAGNSKKNSKRRTNIHNELIMYKRIFDSLHYGGIVTDVDGYITHFNKPYGQFLGLDPEAQIGKHCTEVIENTRMHIVAKTGIPEMNISQHIKGQDMVVQRIPIKKNGKVIAVFGQCMFKDVKDVKKLAEKLSVLEDKVEFYEKELLSLRSTRYTINSIVGASNIIKSLKKEAVKAATNNLPILITGESGTGKEIFAQAIHHGSKRKMYPLMRINCAAIPKDLLESELFGYEKGAFTGASATGKAGKFELAHRGSIFLDEIGDLPSEMQPKLLRVLEEKEFERVGGTSLIRADFRLIVASNQNLEEMVSEGKFRKDLFYRLNVIPLYIPPLRERREDVIPLIGSMLQQIAHDLGLLEIKIDPQVKETLKNYDWPGNIRELSNVLERVSSALDGDTIHICNLPFYLHSGRKRSNSSNRSSLKNVQVKAEKEAIRSALESTSYNKVHAAKLLGIHRTLLYKKMKKYNLALDTNISA